MKKILLAFQFMTIVPIRVGGEVTEKDVAASAAFFPLVGAFQGLVAAVSACLLAKVLPEPVAAALAMVCLILTNGGFDLDGLADTFDGMAVKSSGDAARDRAKRLAVMKDSATGSIGVIALVMTLLVKFLLMAGLLRDTPPLASGGLFFLMAVCAKWIIVPAMCHATSARPDGLGKIFITHAGGREAAVATVIAACLIVPVVMLSLTGTSFAKAVVLSLIFLTAIYLWGLLAVRLLTKRFGGLTGDHFGALTEVTELFFLLLATLWVRPPYLSL